MRINQAFLVLAISIALAACSNPTPGDASASEASDATGQAQPAAQDTTIPDSNNPAVFEAAADMAAVSAASVASATSNGDNPAAQAREMAKETAAPIDAKASNILAQSAATAATAADGKALYQSTCIACHGNKGQGAIPGVPNLTRRLAKSDAELVANILNGFQTKGSPMAMPPKGGNPNLTAADAKALVVYLRTLVGVPK